MSTPSITTFYDDDPFGDRTLLRLLRQSDGQPWAYGRDLLAAVGENPVVGKGVREYQDNRAYYAGPADLAVRVLTRLKSTQETFDRSTGAAVLVNRGADCAGAYYALDAHDEGAQSLRWRYEVRVEGTRVSVKVRTDTAPFERDLREWLEEYDKVGVAP